MFLAFQIAIVNKAFRVSVVSSMCFPGSLLLILVSIAEDVGGT